MIAVRSSLRCVGVWSLLALAGTGMSALAQTSGGTVTGKFGGLVLNRATATFNSILTLTNSGTPVSSPLTVVISTGTPAVTVTGASSNGGNSFTSVVTLANSYLLRDESQTVVVAFADPSRIGFTPTVISATGAAVPPLLTMISPPTSGGFVLDGSPLALGGPVSFDNFHSAYMPGGIIPPGGAAIDVTSVAPPPPPLSTFISSELQGSTNQSAQTVTVSGISCTEVSYTDAYTANLTYQNVAVYCPSATALYKFYLSYNAGDQDAAQYIVSFNQVLNSATLR